MSVNRNQNDRETYAIRRRGSSYSIPEFSFTGDLISFERCPLQYRYWRRANWKPTRPVQFWFGEFIHKIMAKAYIQWSNDTRVRLMSWDWLHDIRPMEEEAFQELRALGIPHPGTIFCPYIPDYHEYHSRPCPIEDQDRPHQLRASVNAENAIKYIGPIIYPFIERVEVPLRGLERFPNYNENRDPAQFFQITGVIDVLSSVKVYEGDPNATLISHLSGAGINLDEFEEEEFEIIIDYKAMRRPTPDSSRRSDHILHELQVRYYSYLRSIQEDAKPVRAGILFYLNEYNPSDVDLRRLVEEYRDGRFPVSIPNRTLNALEQWYDGTRSERPQLPILLKQQRAIRILSIDERAIDVIRQRIQELSRNIQNHINNERTNQNIRQTWPARRERETCTACDIITSCTDRDNIASEYGIDIRPRLP